MNWLWHLLFKETRFICARCRRVILITYGRTVQLHKLEREHIARSVLEHSCDY